MSRSSKGALLFLFAFTIAACSGAYEEPTGVGETAIAETALAQTQAPLPTATAEAPQETPAATPTAFIERRWIEVEWPPRMNLGESDIIRLSLTPFEGGYSPQVEFGEHDLQLQTDEIPHIAGFDAFAIARMDAVGFDFSPEGDQEQRLIPSQGLDWRWSIAPLNPGTQRLSLLLRIRWVPIDEGRIEEVSLWDNGFEIEVNAPFGVSAPQARILGVLGVLVGMAMAIPLAEFAVKRQLDQVWANRVRRLRPNLDLELEVAPGLHLTTDERRLLQALYRRYARLHVEIRFASGYSGARTFLVQPFYSDGRADAFAIVKIGTAHEIRGEYANYEIFVRHTLPPVTSRVQGPPVVVRDQPDAALEYTFVGMPGVTPMSFRSFALTHSAHESKELIEKGLFRTFGAGWWMQRVPHTFRFGSEYDRLLPVHLLLEFSEDRGEDRTLPDDTANLHEFQQGEIVKLMNPTVVEVRPERKTATLSWSTGRNPPVRVRFQNVSNRELVEGTTLRQIYGKVVKSRQSLLITEVVKCFPELDLEAPQVTVWGRTVVNPLTDLGVILETRLAGTRSVIHGDLNLENILVGPGDLVWLIDFASTREGHTLFDFARLEAELTTQIVTEVFTRGGLGPENLFRVFDALEIHQEPEVEALQVAYQLLSTTRQAAKRLLFDATRSEELELALYLAYLGTLKFSNLDELPSAPMPKALAFAAAAYLITKYKHSS